MQLFRIQRYILSISTDDSTPSLEKFFASQSPAHFRPWSRRKMRKSQSALYLLVGLSAPINSSSAMLWISSQLGQPPRIGPFSLRHVSAGRRPLAPTGPGAAEEPCAAVARRHRMGGTRLERAGLSAELEAQLASLCRRVEADFARGPVLCRAFGDPFVNVY
jgi:hypothetical protein